MKRPKEQTEQPIKPVDNRRENGTFGPGNNANPNGRPPKDWSWSSLLDSLSEEVDVFTGKTYREAVARELWGKAIAGNLGAIKELMSRMEGLPKQITEIQPTEDHSKLIIVRASTEEDQKDE